MTKYDFRVTFIFKIIIRICKKKFWVLWCEFCGKTFKFSPKMFIHFLHLFYLNKEELIQQICLIKYIEIEIPNSTS